MNHTTSPFPVNQSPFLDGLPLDNLPEGMLHFPHRQERQPVAYQLHQPVFFDLRVVTRSPPHLMPPLPTLATEVFSTILLHMRRLPPDRRELRQKAACRALHIYAPLADRIGLDRLRRQFEDLALEYLHPSVFRRLKDHICGSDAHNESCLEKMNAILEERLIAEGFDDFRILGRVKSLYSIHQKMRTRGIPLEQIYDRIASRLIFKSVRQCYEALDCIHRICRPVPGRVKDFIRAPKPNRYQSLHTTVHGPFGELMEIQIRTEKMDTVAHRGSAAHWVYKQRVRSYGAECCGKMMS